MAENANYAGLTHNFSITSRERASGASRPAQIETRGKSEAQFHIEELADEYFGT
jgi:hypothetical protein